MAAVFKGSEGVDRERAQLSQLLKRARARISAESRTLGAFLRLPARIGKPTTQEEIAEAAGMSRQWYALLEAGHEIAVSTSALARIADALMLDADERSTFFRLAVPGLPSAAIIKQSTSLLDTFGALRRFTQRLWTASTEAEALTLVREHATSLLGGDAMVTCRRCADGEWQCVHTDEIHDRITRLHGLIRESYPETALDEYHCYPALIQPGELMTGTARNALFRDPTKLHQALEEVGLAGARFDLASVPLQHGSAALLALQYGDGYTSSEVERAQFSALVMLTTLAISGRTSTQR